VEINVDKENLQIMESFVISNFFNFSIEIDQKFLSFIQTKYGGKQIYLTA
jgi:hypothetical protein